MVSTPKTVEEDSDSSVGVTNAVCDRSSIRQQPEREPDAASFARSCLSQYPLNREGGTSDQVCGLLRRAVLSIKFTRMASPKSL